MSTRGSLTKAWQSLVGFAVLIVGLFAVLGAGVLWSDATWAPKLALDLEGGTQIILTPEVEGANISGDQLDQAVAIIRQRVDGTGVAEAEINTHGGNSVVVGLPGQLDDETRDLIQASADLSFRPVITIQQAPQASPSPEPTESASGQDQSADQKKSSEPSSSPQSLDAPSSKSSELTGADIERTQSTESLLNPQTGSGRPSDPSSMEWLSYGDIAQQLSSIDCAAPEKTAKDQNADTAIVACDETGTAAYVLGPVQVPGSDIADASAGLVVGPNGTTTNEWGVNLEFNAEGSQKFGQVTEKLIGQQSPQNQFAIVLDNEVISAPTTNAVISDGKAQISGSFTQESATALANQLKYGSLPMSFDIQSEQQISATLGGEQLKWGIISGLIGLALVVVYSLVQYRGLGFVTIFSLFFAAVLAYLIVTLLSWREGYRLSLAGVAGLIVAIGITADSFIVYFERVKDELRDGRNLDSAIDRGWKRAIRTITVSDMVNFLAAAVLFLLSIGSVRGFALTLGLTTLIDIVVVVLFTHPLLQILGKTKFFREGHAFSGLDEKTLGRPIYYRGRLEVDPSGGGRKRKSSQKDEEPSDRLTIAERKAAAEKAQFAAVSAVSDSDSDDQQNTSGEK